MSRVTSFGRRFYGNLSSDARAGLFGLGWSYLTHGLQLVFRLGSSLILTRLLLPEAYGVYGPALAVIFLLDMLCDLGVQPAVVRSSMGDTPEFLGTARSILMLRAIPLSVAVAALAWVLPAWYDIPALHGVLLALSIRPLILSLLNPTVYVLYRRLNYRTPFFLEILQALISIPITILLAWQLRSVWALVLGLLIGDAIRIILSHILCPRAPRPCWHRPAVHELMKFGFSVFRNTLAYGAWIYFDRIAGPKLISPGEMGLYILAWNLAEAMDMMISRGGDVFYSMLARFTHEEDRAAFVRRTARRASLYLAPCLFAGAIVAPWALEFLYPKKFHGAAILFGLLTARLIMRATGHIQFMHLMMRGEVYIATRAYLISLAILASTFVLWVDVFGLGVLGVAISSVLAMTTFTLIQTAQMLLRREVSPWPALAALAWTVLAVYGVMLVHG